MNDHDDTTTSGHAPFDDDRLLGYVLGFGDVELEAALESSPELQARIAALRAEVSAIASGLDGLVPPEPDGYADPAAERWSALRPAFDAPASATTRRRSWRRVLVPVAAAVAVLAVGAVATTVGGRDDRQASTSAAPAADGGAAAEDTANKRYGESAATPLSGTPTAQAGGTTAGTATPAVPTAGSDGFTEAADQGREDYRAILTAKPLDAGAGTRAIAVDRVVRGSFEPSQEITLDVAFSAQNVFERNEIMVFLLPKQGRTPANGLLVTEGVTYRGKPVLILWL